MITVSYISIIATTIVIYTLDMLCIDNFSPTVIIYLQIPIISIHRNAEFCIISYPCVLLKCCFSPQPHNNNAFDWACNWVVLCVSLTFPWLLWMCFCLYVGVCQCLQRIWRRAWGRWSGSCYNWRETWRLSPPQMTPKTCSSPKWQYPLHIEASLTSPEYYLFCLHTRIPQH